MKFYLAIVLVLAIIQTSIADTWIVTKRGIWKIEDGTPVKVTSDDDRVVIDGIKAPDDPDDPDPPTGVVAKVTALSVKHVKSKGEATGLLAVVRVFRRPDVDLAKAREGLQAAIRLLGPIFEGNEFTQWLSGIEDLHQGYYTSEFLAAVDKGLASAFGLAAGEMNDFDVSQAQAKAKSEERLDLIQLFEIIKMIIELLRDLGIIGGAF